MGRTLTAMFDHRVEAVAVRNRLIAASIAPDRIRIHADTAVPGPHEHGLWAEMLGMLVPEEDRRVMHEGISRGGAVLTVRVDDAQADAALRILEAAHPAEVGGRKVASRPAVVRGHDV
jgi:hypothetical protein